MSLTRQEILKVSELAHIKLADDEIDKFRDQMSSVLDYVGQLSEVDVKGIEPAAHISGVSNVLRNDEVLSKDPATRKILIEAAPEHEGDLIKVKSVFK